MHVDYFDWDHEDDPHGNFRQIISAGFDPDAIEEIICGYHGPIETTRETGREMIRTTTRSRLLGRRVGR